MLQYEKPGHWPGFFGSDGLMVLLVAMVYCAMRSLVSDVPIELKVEMT